MALLSNPSTQLASRILSEVNFDQRLEGFRLRERAGILAIQLYSVSEIVGFLSDPFPRIDFIALSDWVLNVMEDPELSEMITGIAVSDASDLEKTRQIRNLMGIRLVQSKKMI